MPQPKTVTHIGLTVPDIEAAVSWYRDLFGFELIRPIDDIDVSEGQLGTLTADVFGPKLRKFRLAHLSTGGETALEIFEFVDPPVERRPEPFEWWMGGFSHLCVIDPDVVGLATRIEQSGGKIRTSQAWHLFEDQPYRICYCEDPWGTVLEIYSHPHHETWAPRGT
jgi:catechol 2,3-dioxygenase-like lactoylglutathione lyase family enzyme